MQFTISPVNPAFRDYVLQYASELEDPRFSFVGTEGYGDATYVFEGETNDAWKGVAALKGVLRRPPIAGLLFCQVAPKGAIAWPPLFKADEEKWRALAEA